VCRDHNRTVGVPNMDGSFGAAEINDGSENSAKVGCAASISNGVMMRGGRTCNVSCFRCFVMYYGYKRSFKVNLYEWHFHKYRELL
jgi:hypothetical protein